MSLRLVTGPANAAKAGHVLGAFRARLAEEPLLVVPAFRDVEQHQRHLAAVQAEQVQGLLGGGGCPGAEA